MHTCSVLGNTKLCGHWQLCFCFFNLLVHIPLLLIFRRPKLGLALLFSIIVNLGSLFWFLTLRRKLFLFDANVVCCGLKQKLVVPCSLLSFLLEEKWKGKHINRCMPMSCHAMLIWVLKMMWLANEIHRIGVDIFCGNTLALGGYNSLSSYLRENFEFLARIDMNIWSDEQDWDWLPTIIIYKMRYFIKCRQLQAKIVMTHVTWYIRKVYMFDEFQDFLLF